MVRKIRKGSNFRQISAAVPELSNDEDIREAANTLDEAQDLQVLADSEGGKVLLERKIKESSGALKELILMSRKEHSHILLLRKIVEIEVALDLIYELANASDKAEEQQNLVDQLIQRAA